MIERFQRCPVVPVFIELHAATKKFSILEAKDVDISKFTNKEKRGRKKVNAPDIKCPCCKKKFTDKLTLIKHWLKQIKDSTEEEDEAATIDLEEGSVAAAVVALKDEPQEGPSNVDKADKAEPIDPAQNAVLPKNDYDLDTPFEDLPDFSMDDYYDNYDSDDYLPEALKKSLKKRRVEPKKQKAIKASKPHKESKALRHLNDGDRKEALYECEKCKKRFQAKGAVKKHMVKLCYVHLYGGPKITCSMCDEKFVRKNEYKRHIKLKHSMVPTFSCDFCPETYAKKSELKKHIKTHPKPWKCSFCTAAFKRKQHLINHSVKHSDVRPFVCDACGATFKLKQNLADHKKTHGNNRIYMCHVCSGTFKTVTTLYHHMKTHSDYKPFACDTCNFRFKKRHDLKKHMLTHSDVKPFVCDLCGYASKRVSDLNSHKKTVHSIFFNSSRNTHITNNTHNVMNNTSHNAGFIVGSNNAIAATANTGVLVVMNNALTVTNNSAMSEAHPNAIPEAHSSNATLMNVIPEAHNNSHNNAHAGAHSGEHNNEQNNPHNNVFSHIIFSNPYGNFVNQNGKMISL
nr:PREDICTED: GDNF-inducible zinc finger protein 1-like [Bemisia tabaci]